MSELRTVSQTKGESKQVKTTVTKAPKTRTTKAEATGSIDEVVPAKQIADDNSDIAAPESGDGGGNTVFILCIVAFIAAALGLGFFLWRKYKQNQAISHDPAAQNNNGNAEAKSSAITSVFGRKKNRPSPLPLTTVRNPSDPSLPPYSPYAAGAEQSPWLGGNFTMQTAQAVQAGDRTDAADPISKMTSSQLLANLNRARREAAERAGTPFSPFAPFSPVTTGHPMDRHSRPHEEAEADHGDEEAAIGRKPPSSASRYAFKMPQPAPVRYMDPEAAQAMGIHPEVIKTAEPGISEAEIERRRARAQRRLEERQRAEEGSVVEDEMETMHFSQIAGNRRS